MVTKSIWFAFKGVLTPKAIVTCYRKIVTRVLEDRISDHLEILAIDKIPRHLLNLTMNGNINRVKRYSSINEYLYIANVVI